MFSFPTSKWVGNIFYEHGHRLIASVVGMLTVVLALWLVRSEPRRWVRRLGIVALAAVIAQGILGGLTVRLMLRLVGFDCARLFAEAFFCITMAIAFITSKTWQQPALPAEVSDAHLAQNVTLTTTIAIYVQIILGATIRHAEWGIFAHILGAVTVFGCIVSSLFVLFMLKHRTFIGHAILLLVLVMAQIILGMITLIVRVPKNAGEQLSMVQILVPTAHLALGALVLATSLVMTLKAFRFLATAGEEPSLPLTQGALS